jgi:predicted component of type VI protein secretion system
MDDPHIQIASTGATVALRSEVTTVGRGRHVDVRLDDPSVAVLHAEIVRRGAYVYVLDMGLSRTGTRVNGRLVARRLLANGDVLTFGSSRCRIGGLSTDEAVEVEALSPAPELTRRELDVIAALCNATLSGEVFAAPATTREIAAALVVTEAAVKQHLLRLYSKLKIPQGPSRRMRLANEVLALGLAWPQPTAELPRDTLAAITVRTGGPAVAGSAGYR